MLFWIIAALITLAIAASLGFAMLRGRQDVVETADVAMYRDQLGEVDRDLARGTIDEAEAARAKTEVARRLLAADRAATIQHGEAPRGATQVMVAVVLAVLLVGTLLAYLQLGRPGFADQPLAARHEAAELALAQMPAQADLEAAAAEGIAANIVTPPADILANVEALRAAVAADPQALAEAVLLRDFEAGTRNFPAAAALTRDFLPLLEGDDRLQQQLVLLELQVLSANGAMSAESADLLAALAAEIPTHPGVVMYRGLLMESIGRGDLAFGLWRPLVESGETSPYHERIRQMIPAVAWQSGVDYTVPPARTQRGPDAAALSAAENMDAAQRDAMILGMVEQLSSRLASQGGSASEWAQLITALGVLGETEQANAIWLEARQTFATDPGLAEIDAAAEAAGLDTAPPAEANAQ